MNYGLYLSASGVLTNLYRQDVYANNLANVSTVGFKRDLASISQRDPESIEEGFGPDVSNRLLDQLGGGVLAGAQRMSTSVGPMTKTSNPLDVALEEPNAFFVVNQVDPGTGQVETRLTRDGRFTRSQDGYLVTAAGGHRVLGLGDQPIRLEDDSDVTIDPAGRIVQNEEVTGQLQISAVAEPGLLVKKGQNLMAFAGAGVRTTVENARVHQGFVEASSVDPIKALMNMIEASKAAMSNGNMIRYHDTLMDRAVNVLGRVA